MKSVKYSIFLSGLLLMFILTSCERDQRIEQIIGEWDITLYEVGGTRLTGADLENPKVVFNRDKSFRIQMGRIETLGNWRLEEENVYLTYADEENEDPEEYVWEIVELSGNRFVYTTLVDDTDITVTLVPASDQVSK